MKKIISLSKEFLLQIEQEHSIPKPETEYRFHPTRKWKFDYAWPERKVAVEIEGGTWIYGRHNTGIGYHRDLEKYNEAARLGWILFRFDSTMVEENVGIKLLKEFFTDDQNKFISS